MIQQSMLSCPLKKQNFQAFTLPKENPCRHPVALFSGQQPYSQTVKELKAGVQPYKIYISKDQ